MEKSVRLNQELIYLSDKHEFQLKDLMREFDISRRTALRDVEALGQMGLAYYSETGKYGGYKIINQRLLPPVYFNSDEIHSIFFALSALQQLTSTPFEKSYEQIQQKLSVLLPQAQQKEIDKLLKVVHYYSVPPINPPKALALILQSILESKVVSLVYTQYERAELHLQFNEIFYRDGIWFSSAYDIFAEQWGTYRCDYMVDVALEEHLKRTYTLAELNDFQKTYESEFHNIPFRCRLTKFGKESFLKHRYPNMELEEIDGIFYMTGGYHETELNYMVHYLTSFGKHLVVEEPLQLKKAYVKHLKDMLSLME